MKISKIIAMAFAATLLFNVSCRNEDPITEEPKGAYENGIIIANEGGFTTPTSSVSFISNDLNYQENDVFGKNNNNDQLGYVFQSVGLKGDYAYLVMNIPNKVEIVNRYTFKKTGTLTANLDNPRYIAFSGNYTYITNNDFFSVKKVNIYDNNNTFVKSIDFDRYADKVVSSGNFVYVQTDGTDYDVNWNEIPTGHTITRINVNTNTVDKTITFTDNAIIRDMVSDNATVYVLSSDYTESYLYRINASSGNFDKITLTGITYANKLVLENNQLYFLSGNKVYSMAANASVAPSSEKFTVAGSYIYGFNVIDGNIFTGDASFNEDSTVRIYSNSGNLLKTIKTGIATNGFYKN